MVSTHISWSCGDLLRHFSPLSNSYENVYSNLTVVGTDKNRTQKVRPFGEHSRSRQADVTELSRNELPEFALIQQSDIFAILYMLTNGSFFPFPSPIAAIVMDYAYNWGGVYFIQDCWDHFYICSVTKMTWAGHVYASFHGYVRILCITEKKNSTLYVCVCVFFLALGCRQLRMDPLGSSHVKGHFRDQQAS